MGLLDWFRKSKVEAPLPQLCYDVAYFILPHYAFRDLPKLEHLCLKAPSAAGPFFYIMAAQARKTEPIGDDAKRFKWHHGHLDDGREYFALEYPVPPPIDLSNQSDDDLLRGMSNIVLAPYFSAVVRSNDKVPQYFVLGQAPIGGGTTLRCLLPEGMNCNLGPGPEPSLRAFLDAIRDRA